MNRFQNLIFSLLITSAINAQTDTLKPVQLEEVVVKAFEQNRRLKDVPAAVNYVSPQTFNRFSNTSLIAAMNSTPGIRMEERSPGSYRINIRGSSARAPFGVRNVKIYYNDLPFSDPGGQSYLNQLGFYNVNSIEVIKGPGSSLYGAGTGGVMLIESLPENARPEVSVGYTTGSYNLQHAYASLTTSTEKTITRSTYQHLESDGYRDHSDTRRDVLSWNGLFRFDSNKVLKTSFLYSDLFYHTPGGLTLNEFNANPKAARAGSATANAAIFQKMFIAGASYTQRFNEKLSNKSILYGAFTEARNPNLRGYDRTSEPHVGGRSVFTLAQSLTDALLTINAGAEWQQGFATANSFKNVNGNPDSLRYYDDIRNRQSFLFANLEWNGWLLTAGASWNQLHLKTQRFTPRALGEQQRKFDNQWAPRFALSKQLKDVTIYTSNAKGFSPPTTAELLPTGGAVNLNLEAEQGKNFDLGVRATLFKKWYLDVNAFSFQLDQTIVQRRDALGGDFYINAGKTSQRGIETYTSYPLFTTAKHTGLLWASHTWHHFRYKEFKRLTEDFSGKDMPGVAPQTIAAGVDLTLFHALKSSVTYMYSDGVALNDANSSYSKSFHLLGARIAYDKTIGRIQAQLNVGVENILDQTYSLGYDINAIGGRFYNAAAGRNYYAGVRFGVGKGNK
jgi:iron complex outermembrane receptor protein